MLSTKVVYQAVIGEIASLSNRIKNLAGADNMPVDADYRGALIKATNFHGYPLADEPRVDLRYTIDGVYDPARLRDNLYSNIVSLVDQDVSDVMPLVSAREGRVPAAGLLPSPSARLEKSLAVSRDVNDLVRQREDAHNLACVLRAAFDPKGCHYDLLFKSPGGGSGRYPAPAIDRIDVTPEDVIGKNWDRIGSIALQALEPVSLGQRIVDATFSPTSYRRFGVAMLHYGQNAHGESNTPMFALQRTEGDYYEPPVLYETNKSLMEWAYDDLTRNPGAGSVCVMHDMAAANREDYVAQVSEPPGSPVHDRAGEMQEFRRTPRPFRSSQPAAVVG